MNLPGTARGIFFPEGQRVHALLEDLPGCRRPGASTTASPDAIASSGVIAKGSSQQDGKIRAPCSRYISGSCSRG